jgi:hypothetical protein
MTEAIFALDEEEMTPAPEGGETEGGETEGEAMPSEEPTEARLDDEEEGEKEGCDSEE